jgi:hypothetical protein
MAQHGHRVKGFAEPFGAIVCGRDSREVVAVSKEYHQRTMPGLKSVLLSHRFGERGDIFDAALDDARHAVGTGLVPYNTILAWKRKIAGPGEHFDVRPRALAQGACRIGY